MLKKNGHTKKNWNGNVFVQGCSIVYAPTQPSHMSFPAIDTQLPASVQNSKSRHKSWTTESTILNLI